MKILNKKLSDHGFVDYIKRLDVKRKIDKLVFHHTSSSEKIWTGSSSMLHYYNLYCSRGWKNGPHIFIAPDGIWLFTPISKQGTHAGPVGNIGSIGIEVVGRYFDAPPSDPIILYFISLVCQILMDKFNLTWDDIWSHYQYDPHSFCTPHITKEWLREYCENHKVDITKNA